MNLDYSSCQLAVIADALDENALQLPGVVRTYKDGSMEVSLLFSGRQMAGAFGRLDDFDEHDRIFEAQSEEGRLVLYGCQMVRKKSIASVGFTTYRVGFAIEGLAQLALEGGAGCTRAEISGLFSWIGEAAIESVYEDNEQFALSPSYFRVLNPSPAWALIKDGISKYSVKAEAYSISSGPGSARGPMITLNSRGLIKQDVKEAVHWRDVFENVRRMRDLLTIASGLPQEVLSVEVSFDLLKDFNDDRPRVWLPIVGLDLIRGEPYADRRKNWLFQFSDIGEEGMSKWQCFSHDRRLRRGYYALVSAMLSIWGSWYRESA